MRENIAALQDQLTGLLIGLARATEGNEDLVTEETDLVMMEGLFMTRDGITAGEKVFSALADRIDGQKRLLVPNCYECTASCGRNDNYDIKHLWEAKEEPRALRTLLLAGIRDMTVYAYPAAQRGVQNKKIIRFFYKVLYAIGMDDWEREELFPIAIELGELYPVCRELLAEK